MEKKWSFLKMISKLRLSDKTWNISVLMDAEHVPAIIPAIGNQESGDIEEGQWWRIIKTES